MGPCAAQQIVVLDFRVKSRHPAGKFRCPLYPQADGSMLGIGLSTPAARSCTVCLGRIILVTMLSATISVGRDDVTPPM
jgi:hypothetical protein